MSQEHALAAPLADKPLAWVAVTLLAYAWGESLHRRSGSHPLVNPMLFAIVLIGGGLALLRVDYNAYAAGGRLLYLLLAPATVALAVPMSRHLAVARSHGPALLASVACGSALRVGRDDRPRPSARRVAPDPARARAALHDHGRLGRDRAPDPRPGSAHGRRHGDHGHPRGHVWHEPAGVALCPRPPCDRAGHGHRLSRPGRRTVARDQRDRRGVRRLRSRRQRLALGGRPAAPVPRRGG
ncbi:MAG: LrgB family protein [Acetobacteraceae bacterium]|nr:LrgB family protein [Acetobacteraceae bacterium]